MSNDAAASPRDAARRRLINLVIPGAGLVLAGRPLAGFGTGLSFAATLNAALALGLLIPDDFPRTAVWCATAAALFYIVAQFLLLRADARDQASGARNERREALSALVSALREGRSDDAAAARLQPLAECDLHVAYRLAQSATLRADADGALAAWERVRQLDPHHIYRGEMLAALRQIGVQRAKESGAV